jgi:hypothetical protein
MSPAIENRDPSKQKRGNIESENRFREDIVHSEVLEKAVVKITEWLIRKYKLEQEEI